MQITRLVAPGAGCILVPVSSLASRLFLFIVFQCPPLFSPPRPILVRR